MTALERSTLPGKALSIVLVLALAACAGRVPDPVEVVQPTDPELSCEQLADKIVQNDGLIGALAKDQQSKDAQNVAAFVIGIFTFGIGFIAADLQETAKKETAALVGRNEHLTELATERGCEQIEVTT